MRKALLERGWFENEDVWSPFYDLKWATKIMDVDFYRLSAHQIVNHFNNNQGLTSKFGVARNLRTLIMGSNIDVDRFFPRCYDLGDQPDFENFVENFKIGFAETVVRRFLVQPDRYHNLELKMRIAIEVLERRIRNFSEIVDSVNNGDYPMITP
jgi:tubulin monoglycylase TTLL3/8